MEKTKMLADSFSDEYDASLQMQIDLDKCVECVGLLDVSSAAILRALNELAEALPHIAELKQQIAEKQKQVDDLLEKMGWTVIPQQENKKEKES